METGLALRQVALSVGPRASAILTAALASGATPEGAAKLANLAAGVVVSRIGTATVNLDDLSKPDLE